VGQSFQDMVRSKQASKRTMIAAVAAAPE
jgi:hypothetical protein